MSNQARLHWGQIRSPRSVVTNSESHQIRESAHVSWVCQAFTYLLDFRLFRGVARYRDTTWAIFYSWRFGFVSSPISDANTIVPANPRTAAPTQQIRCQSQPMENFSEEKRSTLC